MLSRDELEAMREHLHRELETLAGEIATLEAITAPVAPDRAIGRLSRLEAISEKGVNEAVLRSARARESRIRAALQRIGDDDFGRCAQCEEPIPFARLKSVPGTRLCVTCAERAGG